MANIPTYNPNLIEDDFEEIASIQAPCRPVAPLINRATNGLYAPGSTFKVVTAAAAIDSGKYTPTSEVRRSRLLRGLRQARQQLRHDEPVRRAEPARGAQVLGQLRLLQHRQGPRLEADRRLREALRLLLDPAARDAVERARAERPLQGRRALRPRARQRRRSGPLRLRPGAAARDPAADGHGRGHDRERRHADAPVRDRPRSGLRRAES